MQQKSPKHIHPKVGEIYLSKMSNELVEITDTERQMVELKDYNDSDDNAVWLPLGYFYQNFVKVEIKD